MIKINHFQKTNPHILRVTPGKSILSASIVNLYSFATIDLPEYLTKEDLAEKLLLAICEGKEGFGFA